jgi:hypothetical protein
VSNRWSFAGISVAIALIILGSCTTDPCACPPALEVVTVVSGDHQIGAAGQPLAALVVVRADAQVPSATGLPGRTVHFLPQAGSGSVSASSSSTDGEGLVQVSWTLGPDAGEDTLIVRLNSPDVSLSEAIITATVQ